MGESGAIIIWALFERNLILTLEQNFLAEFNRENVSFIRKTEK